MASRMESTGTAGHIQVTEEVFNEMCKRWPRLEDIDQSGDCFSSRASSSETETPALDEASMLTYLNKQICWNWVRRSNVYLKHKGSFTTYLCQVREPQDLPLALKQQSAQPARSAFEPSHQVRESDQ